MAAAYKHTTGREIATMSGIAQIVAEVTADLKAGKFNLDTFNRLDIGSVSKGDWMQFLQSTPEGMAQLSNVRNLFEEFSAARGGE